MSTVQSVATVVSFPNAVRRDSDHGGWSFTFGNILMSLDTLWSQSSSAEISGGVARGSPIFHHEAVWVVMVEVSGVP